MNVGKPKHLDTFNQTILLITRQQPLHRFAVFLTHRLAVGIAQIIVDHRLKIVGNSYNPHKGSICR